MIDILTIPIVYMWVNADDPAYKSRHGLSESSSRNRDNKELLFSLRSLEMYLPWWKGMLYLVTDKQIPSWINLKNTRVKIIDHTSIIPNEYLPTRASNTIEWFLHLIPGIEDYFITMNDDFMFLKPCEPSVFFTDKGIPILPFNTNTLINTKDSPEQHKKSNKIWLSTVHRSMNSLEQKLGKPFPKKYYIQHGPRIFSKRVILQLSNLMRKEIRESIALKERTYETLDTIYIINYFMAQTLKLNINPRKQSEFFIDITDTTDLYKVFEDIKNNTSCHFLCLNDNFTKFSIPDILQLQCRALFSRPSSFEVPGALSFLEFKNNYRFVSFYSEGAPHDGGHDLSSYDTLSRGLLRNKCQIELYTPRKLRGLGFDYAVKEYAERGCVTCNPNAEKLGFYAWKPLIMLLELEKMNDGDILLFHDMNIDKYPTYRENFADIYSYSKRCLDDCGFDFFVSRENYTKRMFHHCKAMTIREMGGDHPYFYNFPQMIVNIIFIRKSEASIALLKEWTEACKNERWLSGTPNENSHQGFIHHCPEQGILGMLIAKWVAERKHNIPIDYPRQILLNRTISKSIIPSRSNYKHLDYLLDYKGIHKLQSMPNLNCVRFVSFRTEGLPFDKCYDLSLAEIKIRELLKGKLPVIFYTPRILRELGYEYSIKEYDDSHSNTLGHNKYAEKLGFFAWKPLIIWLELQKMADGDVLIFHDSNILKYKRYVENFGRALIDSAWECLEKSGFDFVVSREEPSSDGKNLQIKHHCKAIVVRELGDDHPYFFNFPQIISNIIFIRKSKVSMELVEEWMNACKVVRWVSNQPNPEPHREFLWHCADQPSLNVIIAKWVAQRKYNIPLHYPNIEFIGRLIKAKKEVDPTKYDYLEDLYDYVHKTL